MHLWKPESVPEPLSTAGLSAEQLVAIDIGELWEKTPTPGPSHQQWAAWNDEHGVMLRVACGFMARDKEELANFFGDHLRRRRGGVSGAT
jgi:hypothetical protein